MLHFPSQLGDGQSGKRENLNATQRLNGTNPLFLKIEEELHDARRVRAHGQEDDLRMALSMVIDRVSELSNGLAEAYRAQAELESQLTVTRSNLKLVISNNEMLEEALKQDKSVGWRRGGRVPDERPYSADFAVTSQPIPGPSNDPSHGGSSSTGMSVNSAPSSASPPPSQESRFFSRFRLSSNSTSRPGTPTSQPSYQSLSPNNGMNGSHPASSSMPALPTQPDFAREVEELSVELEKERAARQQISKEKAALEAEIETLSQALFEEANKMVASERIRRAETEEELMQAQREKSALKSALRIVEDENQSLRDLSAANSPNASPTEALVFARPERHRTISDISVADQPIGSMSHCSSSATPSRAPSRSSLNNNKPLSRSSSRAGVKSLPSSRSSSLSRASIPPALPIPPNPPVPPPLPPSAESTDTRPENTITSSEESVADQLLHEPDADSEAPNTAKPGPQQNPESRDRDRLEPGLSLPLSTSSLASEDNAVYSTPPPAPLADDDAAAQYLSTAEASTDDLPPSPWADVPRRSNSIASHISIV